jgi:Ser/Thr protein kinase RdoA (MazF antagonist)
MSAALHVMARFGATPLRLVALGSHGGFSGARLWRVTTAAGDWCLKAWPPAAMDAARLRDIHALQRRASDAGLAFVPVPSAAPDGSTVIEHAGRLWDLTTWLPGRADFRADPTADRLRAACAALARLHRAWEPSQPIRRPFPAARRRVESARTWCELVNSGWRPNFAGEPDDELTHTAERAWRLVERSVALLADQLRPLAELPVEVQPCLCDVWHDNVLLDGPAVTGLIDFGSVKPDHVTADLARLLGSLAGDDADLAAEGLTAYAAVRPLGPDAAAHVRTLDRTGTLLGISHWLRWLYHEGRVYDDRFAVARRLGELVRRVQAWGEMGK